MELILGKGFLEVLVVVWLLSDFEIEIGKWLLLCGSAMVNHVEDNIRLREQKEISMAELGQLGLPR